MSKLKFILTSLLVGIVSVSFAQVTQQEEERPEEWSLEYCINYAYKHNIQIQQGMLTVLNSQVTYEQSKWSQAPTLNGFGTHNNNYGRTIDPVSNSFVNRSIQSNNFQLSTGVTLFNGFQIRNTIQQNKYSFMATQQDLEITMNNIALNISNLYLQILFNTEAVNISESQVKTSQEQVDRAQKQYDAGAIPQTDLLNLKAQLANDKYNLITAKNSLDISYVNLKNSLQLGPVDQFEIVKPDFETVPEFKDMDLADLYNSTVSDRPEVRKANLMLMSAEMGYKVANGARSPRLSAAGSLSTLYSSAREDITLEPSGTTQIGVVEGTNEAVLAPTFSRTSTPTPFNDQLKDNYGQSIGVTLSIPIFNGNQVNSGIQRAKITMARNELDLAQAQNTYFVDLSNAYAQFKAADAQYEAAQQNLEAQKLNLEAVTISFNAGVVNTLDYQNALNSKLRAEASMLQAKYELIFRSKIIDFYKGEPLKL